MPARLLTQFDLSLSLDEKTYEKKIPALRIRLGELQRSCRDAGIPVIIVVEGWNASGITMTIQELIGFLDPRGFSLHSIGRPSVEEADRPLLWRFWVRIAQRGRISIFARSWYSRTLAETVSGVGWKKKMKRAISDIRQFERQLADDGTVVIKIFLHISKDEQRRRLDERERSYLTSWMITRGDWDFHRHYDQYLPIIEEFINKTDCHHAPWTVIEATDRRYSMVRAFETVIAALERAMKAHQIRADAIRKAAAETGKKKWDRVITTESSFPREKYNELLPDLQEKVREIQFLLYKRKIPVIILFEGWDAAGKGGNILRLTSRMNPRAYQVVPVSRPNDLENSFHYLWRFYKEFPRAGHITIFDRSWYGRLLVERVEGYCRNDEWQRAYREINENEAMWRDQGVGLIKFWLEIDKDVQLERFHAREADPRKQWKITEEDWRNREKWDEYESAVREMLSRTSTPDAPWDIIGSNDKLFARIETLRRFIERSENILS